MLSLESAHDVFCFELLVAFNINKNEFLTFLAHSEVGSLLTKTKLKLFQL